MVTFPSVTLWAAHKWEAISSISHDSVAFYCIGHAEITGVQVWYKLGSWRDGRSELVPWCGLPHVRACLANANTLRYNWSCGGCLLNMADTKAGSRRLGDMQ